jgi:hypothetical protein
MAAAWQNDPIVGAAPAAGGAGWQNDPVVKGGATAQASDNDYSKSPWSALARTFESSADWGTGDLIRAAITGKKPSETAAQSSAAAASLPWYVRYPTEAAGYGLGLVNLLDPVTDAAEAGALGLGASSGLAKIAGTAAEGATVGGVSHVAGSDDPGLMDTAGAALGGAALGGAAGAAAPLVNKGLTKAFGTKASIDPAAATAATAAAKDTATSNLRQVQINPVHVDNAFDTAMSNLRPEEKTGMSDTFAKTIQDIRDELNTQSVLGKQIDGDTLNSWQREVENAASAPVDKKIAGQISGSPGNPGLLDGVMNSAGGGQLNQAAQQAFKQNFMAENLADWNERAANKGSLGDAPFNEARNYYQPGTPEYDALMKLYSQSQNQADPTWALGHMAAGLAGDIGGAMFGFPGHFGGELLGYLGIKPAIKSAFKGAKQNALQKNIQQVYPTLTGQPLTGAQTGPQLPGGTGDMIKNLMLGVGAS